MGRFRQAIGEPSQWRAAKAALTFPWSSWLQLHHTSTLPCRENPYRRDERPSRACGLMKTPG
jgi:hypothetical protein